jgi:hypothetical protein
MPTLSFRVDKAAAAAVDEWSRRLHIDRSELLREALQHHLANLAGAQDVQAYTDDPITSDETSLLRSPIGDLQKIGRTGPMRRGEPQRIAAQDYPVVSGTPARRLSYAMGGHRMLKGQHGLKRHGREIALTRIKPDDGIENRGGYPAGPKPAMGVPPVPQGLRKPRNQS